MGLGESIQELRVRWGVNPFLRPEPVDFKKILRKTAKPLILLPHSPAHRVTAKTLRLLEASFPGRRLTCVHPGAPDTDGPSLNMPVLHLHLRKQNVSELKKSQVLSGLSRDAFDALVDLDPDFSLVGIYLARWKALPLCIGFGKPHADRYYNLQYNGLPGASFEERCAGLFRFLKSFTAR